MRKLFLLVSFMMLFISSSVDAKDLLSVTEQNVALVVKIAVVYDDQEIEGDEYKFFLKNEQIGVYKNDSQTPYWPKQGDPEVNYFEENIAVNVKPIVKDNLLIVESEIEGCLHKGSSVRNEI